jgi:sugar fermentation stimulation protein A
LTFAFHPLTIIIKDIFSYNGKKKMNFATPLLEGRLIKRYKRFLADIELDGVGVVTAHCANSGAMLGITDPGSRVWVSYEDSPTRKLKYSWHIVEADQTLVGLNTSWPNLLVSDAIQSGQIPH